MEDGCERIEEQLTLVARKPSFGLPTGCPVCLPVYIYLRFANLPFSLRTNSNFPDSDQIPYVESGTYVAFNNEKGGVIESLIEDGLADLDYDLLAVPEWLSTKAMISSWLTDALMYELWVGSDGSSAQKIYFADLPWPIGKVLFHKQLLVVKQLLGITKDSAERRETEIYRKATVAYGALSTRLGEQAFFFENRPTSLDAMFLSHTLFVLQALPDSSTLRGKLLEHSNLVQYAERLKTEFIEASSSSSSVPLFHSDTSSSTPRKGPSSWSSKPKSKPKREKTQEEKTFRRRAKYFLVTQLVAVLVFLSLLSGSDDTEVEFDDDDDGMDYD
ncbi:Metaxin, glutathione S-transferase domain [Dillenia turbinata]|uniref:Metaxin n=1 Tax=Dillenia turbinata TaxID=194707 RepID=A0AAN8YVK8_9MAGN